MRRSKTEQDEIKAVVGDLMRRLLKGNPTWDWAKPRIQAIAERRQFVPGKQPQSKRYLAEEARQFYQEWYWSLGIPVIVPKPVCSNREFRRRTECVIPQALVCIGGTTRE